MHASCKIYLFVFFFSLSPKGKEILKSSMPLDELYLVHRLDSYLDKRGKKSLLTISMPYKILLKVLSNETL